MSIFKSYKIENNNLFLEEHLFWSFLPDEKEVVQMWSLINVDKNDLDKNKLQQLVDYQEDADYEFETINKRIKLTIFIDKIYVFNCDNLVTTKRAYNVEELATFILHHQKTYQEQNSVISKQRKFIENLESFINNEIEKKLRIINNNAENLKANYQFDILNQLKGFIENQMINLKD